MMRLLLALPLIAAPQSDSHRAESDPQRVEGDPQHVESDPQRVESGPQRLESDPRHLGRDRQRVESNPQRVAWNKPTAPFRIVGNIHFVGTAGLSAFLITTTKGHILIDAAMQESADQIAANIGRLGYRVQDIRYILNNHAHWDHSGGLAALKRASGAKLIASTRDRATLEAGRALDRDDLEPFPAVKVDRAIEEGARVTIGDMTLIAHLTPGHTMGCTSWSMTVRDSQIAKGRPLNVIFACSLTVAGQKLVGNSRYPQIVADFRTSYAKLNRMKADVFLNFHTDSFDMAGKRQRQLAGDRAAFVDPGELADQVRLAEADFARELKRQSAKAHQKSAAQ